jgi:ABC-type transport system involved in cytochrome c biogenesis permease subunit
MHKKVAVIFFFILTTGLPLAFAQPICRLNSKIKPQGAVSLKAFQEIPVLSEGRIKPLDTYARALLLQLSGRSSFQRKPAVEWLGRVLFAPALTYDDKVFLINNPEVAAALKIEPESKRWYSFSQLEPGIEKLEELARLADKIEGKDRSVVEREVLRLYQNLITYVRHTEVFGFAFPSPEFQITDKKIIDLLNLSARQEVFSFYDIVSKADILQAKTQRLDEIGRDKWSGQDKDFLRLMTNLYQWSMSYGDLPFHVVPTSAGGQESWLSPQDAINNEFRHEAIHREVGLLRDMAVYYWNGERLPFDLAARSLKNSVVMRVGAKEAKAISKIPLELFYNKADFFLWAKALYGLAFLVFLLSFFFPEVFTRHLSLGVILAGVGFHGCAFVLRMSIMARPPVTNLFETFIFVSFISVVLGVIIELVNQRWLGNVVASVCGVVFLLIAGKFNAEGDTMQMLAAVLDSNFWLALHVISITVGYAGCCVAGLIGHFYLLQGIRYPKEKALLESTYKNLIGTLGFGLMMTFLGTTVGGIWADQSWGRFWGWDPKENGALLIILWCAIIFHARAGRLIGPLGVAVASVLGIAVVMWAWFGVNLLSIGLHSYGFTSGVATGLLVYVIVETIFLSVSVPWAQRRLAAFHPGKMKKD